MFVIYFFEIKIFRILEEKEIIKMKKEKRTKEKTRIKKENTKKATPNWVGPCRVWSTYRIFLYEHVISRGNPRILFFLRRKHPIYSSTIKAIQRTPEAIRITSRSEDHLATTTDTRASRRRAAAITPP
jgi:hypothetical protein